MIGDMMNNPSHAELRLILLDLARVWEGGESHFKPPTVATDVFIAGQSIIRELARQVAAERGTTAIEVLDQLRERVRSDVVVEVAVRHFRRELDEL